MKRIVVLLAVLGLSTSAMADAYAKCVACHGAAGETTALGKSKVIAEFTKAEIVTALNGYKDGTYGGAMKGLMKAQATPLTEADIQAIAEKIGK
ncbi:MAG: c-type cytochrome [Epsilonproteobacteria bacterium]|nr:c-type cytochrome [Campylobacterota bacterium]OIO16770.1 MAG: cytochrome C [Helicobacteraceae bacterium CG1_02_36_14]PIP10075.1 MAG: cytochrome C [Sulfurimonas sp. CG23_combo_of_CG06-09_8_20_14_all_36_33]PIS23671.1 MAG: cytochrome C [Sulfurimonas sp. CG08_land_8_20_14_0_20_36_33]PIU34826.1 MAG: cytochrome C [Sulfurimonas sp. CG07_land_8_20_14_0_80_36_56]PIV05126.1 MAG: cytochrome C [Sulfurimonas sp. CG03_land_8_20_14_0_80_36_25]PIV34901.1 MAG: cytochrome C [Sulfurimonas sp. CG02_land_8_20_